MKKIAVVIAAATLALSACHYGKKEAQSSLDRNKEYKGNAADQGPEISADYVKGGDKPAVDSVATAPVDTAAPAH